MSKFDSSRVAGGRSDSVLSISFVTDASHSLHLCLQCIPAPNNYAYVQFLLPYETLRTNTQNGIHYTAFTSTIHRCVSNN